MSNNPAAKYLADDVNLAVVKNGEVSLFCERGIKALVGILCDDPLLLRGAVAADKIVGKAAALLFVYGGVKAVYAKTVSKSALDVFGQYGVESEFEIETDRIINRTGTGPCPMETAVKDISAPEQAFEVLREKVKALK